MVRKLNFITIVLLSVLLMPLPLYARRGSGFGGGGFNTPRGSSGSLFGGSSYTTPTPKLTPAAESHGILQITLKTQDAEIYRWQAYRSGKRL